MNQEGPSRSGGSARRVGTIARKPLYEEALGSIRSAILSGGFAAGERLLEPELASDLGLSRGPVREALRKLEQEGIVVSSPHQGSSVVTIEREAIDDALGLRDYLETLHCDAVVEVLTDDVIAELESAVDAMAEAARRRDTVALADADFAFHDRLMSVGRTSVVQRVWRSIAGPLRMALALTDPVYLEDDGDIVATHEPILAALRARDAQALEEAMHEHISNVGPLLDRRADADG